MLSMSAAARTDVGLLREHNEDSMLVTESVVAVADGLGGHAAGEVASKIAVDRIHELVERQPIAVADVLAAVAETNERILADVRRNGDHAGMGTTLCGLAVVQADDTDQLLVFNIGDSRVYRLVDGELTQQSVDHSEVAELQAAGKITAEQAATHPRRNVITRCLGTRPSPEPDIWVFRPARHERFLVCSDGLTGEVNDDDIAATLNRVADAGAAADELVHLALAAGGRDNIAVIVVDVARRPRPGPRRTPRVTGKK